MKLYQTKDRKEKKTTGSTIYRKKQVRIKSKHIHMKGLNFTIKGGNISNVGAHVYAI